MYHFQVQEWGFPNPPELGAAFPKVQHPCKGHQSVLDDSPRGTIKSHRPEEPALQTCFVPKHTRSISAFSIKDMVRTSFRGVHQYHRLQEIEPVPELETSVDDAAVLSISQQKSRLPCAPLKPSRRLLLKSALCVPKERICRMSSRVREAGKQIATASVKLAHAHRHFMKPKCADEGDLAIWMVVNPMFNQPSAEPTEPIPSDVCSACEGGESLPVPIDTTYENWVNSAVFGHEMCDYMSERPCALCGNCAQTRAHYRTQSLGDVEFWDTDFLSDSLHCSLSAMSSISEDEGSHF